MARTILMGTHNFERLIIEGCFYIDKTNFIKKWWEEQDVVTLITRPGRFGKTLNMNMLERFFSVKYENRGEIFEGLDIWKEEKYRKLQGTYPVISLSFARMKADNCAEAKKQMMQFIADVYSKNKYLAFSGLPGIDGKKFCELADGKMDEVEASMALCRLSDYLYNYYGKKVIILLDAYDTLIREAYVNGYWKELGYFIRGLFISTFKTNCYLERSVIVGTTGASCVSDRLTVSMFSDLNMNIEAMTSNKYAPYFGFTEGEVFDAMDEFCMTDKETVKEWYGGFRVGDCQHVYNPWPVSNFLQKRKRKVYWGNKSSDELISTLIREGNGNIKMQFGLLLAGKTIWSRIDEEVVLNHLKGGGAVLWSFLLALGYLRIVEIRGERYGIY